MSESPGVGGGTETLSYDGSGQRVEKSISGGATTMYVHDAFGNLAAEYSPASILSKDYIRFGNRIVAVENTVPSPCQTCYLSFDHLGNIRLVTDQNANIISRHDYLSFGEEIPGNIAGRNSQWGLPDSVTQRFTGKERDQESGLDFFGARYYGSALGRFTSPDSVGDGLDPVPVPWANFENPQSLNLYSYVRNNPLGNSDPDGHDCVVQTRTDYDKETVTVSSGNCDNVKLDDGQTKNYIPGTVDVSSIQSNGSGGITFGYTPYEGGAGVADLQGAQIPDNPNLAYYWQNNAQGYQTLRTTAATVGSVKGVALFYAASTATVACALFCLQAVPAFDVAQNELVLKAMAYLESNGIPATKAAAVATNLAANAGKGGGLAALEAGWKTLVPRLNEAIRDYRGSQNPH